MVTREQIQENRQKWLDALRSGKYKQSTNVLKSKYDANSFCGFGLGCEISGIGEWVKRVYPNALGLIYQYQDSEHDNLLGEVMEFYGLPRYVKEGEEEEHAFSLIIDWNDRQQLDFKEFANRLEDLFRLEDFFENIEKEKEGLN